MRSDAEKVQYAVEVLQGAVRSGLVSQDQIAEHLAVLREGEATPVTITLNVTGSTGALRQYGSQVNTEVQRALGGLAQQAGLTIQSVEVSV